MLQHGSCGAVANAHEPSVPVDAEEKQVAERLVEHGVLLSNAQGVKIQKIAHRPWVHNEVTLGWYMPAICLKKIDGLGNLDNKLLVGKYVRQCTDGKIILNDVARILLYSKGKHADQWVNNGKQVNPSVVSSLTWLHNCRENVSYCHLKSIDCCVCDTIYPNKIHY